MSNQPKRRRTDEDAPEVAPSAGPAAVPSNGDAGGGDGEVQILMEPHLDDISKLLLVDMQKNDADDVEEALDKLTDMLDDEECEEWETNKKRAITVGAPATVLISMKKWRLSAGVQRSGCLFMIRLSYKSGVEVDSTLASLGGVEAALNAIKLFPANDKVTENALLLLHNLNHHDSIRSSVSQPFVNDRAGFEILLRAMKQFPDSANIQENCCHIFRKLSREEALRGEIAKAGVISAVAGASEHHWNNQDVKDAAEEFMSEIYSKK